MVGCALLALAVADCLSPLVGTLLAAVLFAAWFLEGTRWQIGERVGLLIVLASLVFVIWYWNFSGDTNLSPERIGREQSLAYFFAWLTVIKIAQRKQGRDWVLLFAISFFEIMIAAVTNFDSRLAAIALVYLFAVLCVGISFEIHKSLRGARLIEESAAKTNGNLQPQIKIHDAPSNKELIIKKAYPVRLFGVAFGVFALVLLLAFPVFFVAPRISRSAQAHAKTSSGNVIGFTDTMTLGNVGRLQESDELVMRVQVENEPAARFENLRWRGAALDYFTGTEWKRSVRDGRRAESIEENLFRLGTTRDVKRLVRQTFFIEPNDTPVLFAAPRLVALEGALPYVLVDAEGGVQSRTRTQGRVTYRAYSDIETSSPDLLRDDKGVMPSHYARYLQLPATIDSRFAAFAFRIAEDAGAQSNYDSARAIESYLRSNFSYSLDMQASGEDPLADFLFNLREGHCEYFATSMAVMLRTQGVPARVVTGFQSGEYNETADAYVVRGRDAHAWVEVYFSGANQWASFDPTPAWNRAGSDAQQNFLMKQLGEYSEAFEMFWVQYVATYGKQEQRWLAGNLRERLNAGGRTLAQQKSDLQNRWREWYQSLTAKRNPEVQSQTNFAFVLLALFLLSALAFIAYRLRRKFGKSVEAQKINDESAAQASYEFYERMIRAMEQRGVHRSPSETPAEFAKVIHTPEASALTAAFERVRYGGEQLSQTEIVEIERCLRHLEEANQIEATIEKV